jgi:hypothetical protein
MSDAVIVLVLALVAALITGLELIRTRGQDLTCWAVLALAIAMIVDII